MAAFDSFLPKHHMLVHLLFSQKKQGNPSAYSNWQDEALNKTLKASCRFVLQLTFELGVLMRVKDILEKPPKREA
jgi:hypothetical protein